MIRYHEATFNVGRKVAVLGVAHEKVINGVKVMELNPCNNATLNATYYEKHGWTEEEVACWKTVLIRGMIGFDDEKFMLGLQVDPATDSLGRLTTVIAGFDPATMQGGGINKLAAPTII